jgi:hypothetical protein
MLAVLAAFLLWRVADYDAYAASVDAQTGAALSAAQMGSLYSALFDSAGHDRRKKCYLEHAISARLASAIGDPPAIPDNVVREIRRQLASPASGCYAALAQDLASAEKFRKQSEFSKIGRYSPGLDPILNRDTPDHTPAEIALGELAPNPVPKGWLYLGKTRGNGTLDDPTLQVGSKIPRPGTVARVAQESLVEGNEPDPSQDAPDVAGVYQSSSTTVKVDRIVLQMPYVYAFVEYVRPNKQLVSEAQ